jgi:hypothetical protein
MNHEYPFHPEDSARMTGRRGRHGGKPEAPLIPDVIASEQGAGEQVFEAYELCNQQMARANFTERERVCHIGKHWWDLDDRDLSRLLGCSTDTVLRARRSAEAKLAALH